MFISHSYLDYLKPPLWFAAKIRTTEIQILRPSSRSNGYNKSTHLLFFGTIPVDIICFSAFQIKSQKSKSGGNLKYDRVQGGYKDSENKEEILLNLAKFLKRYPTTKGHRYISYQIKMVDAWPNPIIVSPIAMVEIKL